MSRNTQLKFCPQFCSNFTVIFISVFSQAIWAMRTGQEALPLHWPVWGLRPSPTEHSDNKYNSESLRKTEKLRVSDWVLRKWTPRRQCVWRKLMGSALRIGISEEVGVGQREELNYHQQRPPWTACWVLGLDWISSTVQFWGKDVGLSTLACTGHWPQATCRKRIMTLIGCPWLRANLESSSARAVSHQLSASGPWCLHPARRQGLHRSTHHRGIRSPLSTKGMLLLVFL